MSMRRQVKVNIDGVDHPLNPGPPGWPKAVVMQGHGPGARIWINVKGRSPEWVQELVSEGNQQLLRQILSNMVVDSPS